MNDRLKKIKNTPDWFGGISVIVCGDFAQIPPVAGKEVYLWSEDMSDMEL